MSNPSQSFVSQISPHKLLAEFQHQGAIVSGAATKDPLPALPS
jgi:hypothetical protein